MKQEMARPEDQAISENQKLSYEGCLRAALFMCFDKRLCFAEEKGPIHGDGTGRAWRPVRRTLDFGRTIVQDRKTAGIHVYFAEKESLHGESGELPCRIAKPQEYTCILQKKRIRTAQRAKRGNRPVEPPCRIAKMQKYTCRPQKRKKRTAGIRQKTGARRAI